MQVEWIFAQPSPSDSRRIADALGVHPLVAQLLVNRRITTPEEARSFLNPNLDELHSPQSFSQMTEAVERINLAMQRNEKIFIFGDYDVDGVCSIAMLVRFFKLLHYSVDYYVPSRSLEGYGLNEEAVKTIAEKGARLLIAVDCGINDVEEIKLAHSLGIDVIIVDHHEYSGEPPPAVAILDPKFGPCGYPFRDLAAVGVTFKLVEALGRRMSGTMKAAPEYASLLKEALGLVALGSVADVVPLRGENRVLVYHGMKALAQSQLPGLTELFDTCSINPANLKTWHIAYNLAPRINAAGRLTDAATSVKLLTTDSTKEAAEIARTLESENRRRQKIEEGIFLSAIEKLGDFKEGGKPKVIVLSDDSWHPGVIGIVASRLVEQFHCPTVLIALDGDVGRGSARSIPSYHIYEALGMCEEKLLNYGGHAAAAGLEILKEDIESFHMLLLQDAEKKLSAQDLKPKLFIDAKISPEELSFDLLDQIAKLAPNGSGNPLPLFAAEDVTTAGQAQMMGSSGKHVSFRVQSGKTIVRAIAFNYAHILDSISNHGTRISIAFRPHVSSYSGRIELDVKDIRLC